jgi:hypothetical protein
VQKCLSGSVALCELIWLRAMTLGHSRRNPPYWYYPAAPPAPICWLPHTTRSAILLLCYLTNASIRRQVESQLCL